MKVAKMMSQCVALASIILLFLIKNAQLKVGELVALIATLAFIVLALSRFDF